MGSLESILGMIPGVGNKLLKSISMDTKRFKRLEAIILSMTPEERARPKIIDSSRRKRIAAGSGAAVQDINHLLKQFDEMRKVMKQMGFFSSRGGPGTRAKGITPFFN
jgi:signal recognition particle subunit SRP54